MAAFDKPLKVSKVDTYTFTVPKQWLADESIVSHSVAVDSKLALNASAVIDNVIGASITGVSTGGSIIHFEYETTTGRTDCEKHVVKVIDDC